MLSALLLLAITVGCSSDDGSEATADPRDTDQSTSDESTSTTTASVEDEIVDRYVAFWEARFAANTPPNPDDPLLREYATGEALLQVVAEAEANRAAGVEFRQRDDPSGFQRVDVIEVSDDTAAVQECVVDDGLVVRSSDGSVVNDTIATHSMRGEMDRVDGEWRLARSDLVQRWEGVAGCALAP